ncbi:hypothetical protein [Exiguobacterium sp. s162]|uniref:hypothetical protein n=1 Tax=Exiguobacterium sp. s162 TaxID=2751276 RepID=UPI001BE5B51D|nr:hypothetical protein [Exiguobacterium sp. s162]
MEIRSTFDYVGDHEITKTFIQETRRMLRGFVIECMPEPHSISMSNPLRVNMRLHYRAGIKANKGLKAWLETNGWRVGRRETTDEDGKAWYIFEAYRAIHIPIDKKEASTYGGQ